MVGCASTPISTDSAAAAHPSVSAPLDDDAPIEPAKVYGGRVDVVFTQDESSLWQVVEQALGANCAKDGALTLAARMHAADVLAHPSMMINNGIDYVRFALRVHGSPDYLISPLVFDPGEHGQRALLQKLGNDTENWTHCGMGVAELNGKKKAVFIGASRVLSMNSIPVQLAVGSSISIAGKFVGNGVSNMETYLELPNGNVRQLKTFVLGKQRFAATVPFETAGKYKLELLVTRSSGPETAVLVPLFVGVPVEIMPSVFPAPDASNDNPKEMLTQLINRIRENQGLRALKRDKRLDDVAQQHCGDMAASGSFGHVSRRSGMLADRLKAKGLYPKIIAENIAQSSTVMRVHHNLMQSPSHKIKLLTPEYTHLGLGVKTSGDTTVVTQVFATW